jgi:hypothetical protein
MPLDTEPNTENDAGPSAGAEATTPEGSRFHLPKLGSRIRRAIDEYGGSVFPKLNWTAPRVCRSPLLVPSSVRTLIFHGQIHVDPQLPQAMKIQTQC